MATVILQLRPETEQVLRDKADRCGRTLEAYIQILVEEAAQTTNGATAAGGLAALSVPEGTVAEWDAWVASHRPLPGIADDSREGIYAGRGE